MVDHYPIHSHTLIVGHGNSLIQMLGVLRHESSPKQSLSKERSDWKSDHDVDDVSAHTARGDEVPVMGSSLNRIQLAE